MAENSLFWGGTTIGDAGPYSSGEFRSWFRKIFISDPATQGVLRGYANELAVSGAGSPISVAAGAALVYGAFYENSDALYITVPLPASATRYDRIVLRKDWTAQTVRCVLKTGAEGSGAPPALTQVDGSVWEIPLATLTVTTGGGITVADNRNYVVSNNSVYDHLNLINNGVLTHDEIDRILNATVGPNGGAVWRAYVTSLGEFLQNGYSGGSLLLAESTWTTVPFDALSTGLSTALQSNGIRIPNGWGGVYKLGLMTAMNAIADARPKTRILINGSVNPTFPIEQPSAQTDTPTGINPLDAGPFIAVWNQYMRLNGNDLVQLQVWHNSTVTRTLNWAELTLQYVKP